jgi:hypothetical protein
VCGFCICFFGDKGGLFGKMKRKKTKSKKQKAKKNKKLNQ